MRLRVPALVVVVCLVAVAFAGLVQNARADVPPNSGEIGSSPPSVYATEGNGTAPGEVPAPRPIAVDGSSHEPPPGFSGHYYAGSVFSAWPRTATELQVSIRVPHDYPDGHDFYYVLLSVWDDNDVYDQIGFSGFFGTWGLTYAALNKCGTGNDYSANAMTLSRGVLYTFKMTVSSGTVTFSAYIGATQVWTLSRHTGGTAFVLADYYSCSGNTYYDYTNYEEVYEVQNQEEPSWSFFFHGNQANGGLVVAWSSFYQSSPSDVVVYVNYGDTTIDNQWFMVLLTYDDIYAVASATSLSVSGSLTRLYTDYWCFWYLSCNVYLEGYAAPSGWSLSFSPDYCYLDVWTSSCSFTMTISIPSGTPAGNYWVGVKAEDWLLRYTTFRLGVHLTSGGGGCVAFGTLILTPSGYVSVQRLKEGDKAVGYDLGEGRLVTLNVTAIEESFEAILISVNAGSLVLTPYDQPIYIKNVTFEGWLRDPGQLTVGTMIFDAVRGEWVPIVSLEPLYGKTKVYDIATDGPNNFIANGYLLDRKPRK